MSESSESVRVESDDGSESDGSSHSHESPPKHLLEQGLADDDRAYQNYYKSADRNHSQEARPFTRSERSGGETPNLVLLGEPRSMCANEPDIHERIENDETAYQDSDVLEHLYHVEGLTQGEIGELFGVTKSPVSDWMDKHEIETRSQSEASLRSVLKLPACFFTGDDGYEYWTTKHYENREQVYVHRLLAVAKFGFEEVCDAQVHHRNGVRWDNRAENIEVLSVQSHRKKHRKVSEDKILTAISEKQESGSATVESIADTVGLDTSHAYRRLRDLISDGKIHSTKEQHSRGGFRLHYHLNTPSGGSEG